MNGRRGRLDDMDAAGKIINISHSITRNITSFDKFPPQGPHWAVRSYRAIPTFGWLGDDPNNGEGLSVWESMLIPQNFQSFSLVLN